MIENLSEWKHLANVVPSTSLVLPSVNTSCLLGHYSHALWDCMAQALPVDPKTFTLCSQAIQDGCDEARFIIHCGLDTTNFIGLAIGTSVANLHHAWLRFTGITGKCPVLPNGHAL